MDVNFLYDDIVHALQNTIDSCINSATNRRGYVLEHRFTKFIEIIHPKAIGFGEIKRPSGLLRRSRSSNITEFDTNRKLICDFLLVINTNLAPILHRFRDIALDMFKIAIFGYPSCV